MSVQERAERSRLLQILHDAGVIRGSLVDKSRSCGKPTCKCAKGEKHPGLGLQVWLDGHSMQFAVPRAMEAEVRKWVEQYQEVQDRLDRISDMYREKMRSARKAKAKKKGGD